MTSVCAIVPTYNRQDSLQQCLEALLRQSRRLDGIVVIDNASSDGTHEMIGRRFGGRVSYVRLPENTGSAGGFHEGMKWAWERDYDWIWCLDNDAIPADDCLQKLLEAQYSSEVPAVARVCARRDPETGKAYAEAEIVDVEGRTHWNLFRKDWSHWDGKVVPVDAAPWGGLLVEARAARRTSGQWRDMFFGFDDYVFSYELRKLGRILFVADAKVAHPQVRGQVKKKHHSERVVARHFWKAYYSFRNSFLWEKLEFGRWSAWRRYLVLYLRYLVGILLFDDFKMYRIGIRTRAMIDILLRRRGRRVEPGDFDRRYGSSSRLDVQSSPSAAAAGWAGKEAPKRQGLSSPKIVYVLESLDYGGLEWQVVELLPRLKARGIDVEAVVFLEGGPLLRVLAERGIKVITLGLRSATIYRLDQWVPTAWRLRRYLQASSAEIVHSQHYLPDVITCLAARRGTPIISTVNQWEPWWDDRHRLRSRLKARLDVTLARWRDVRVIVISQDTASAVTRTFRLKPERLRVIYDGIDLNRFPLDQPRSLPRDASAPVMIQVGSMCPRKGHSVSIEAFPLVLRELPKASLLFVGDGPLRGDLEAQARALGLQAKVRFLGNVDDVAPWLHASDLFWMPSRFEGLGLACAEAMACGLPTVTTNVIGLREVAVHGVTGFVVPPDSPESLAEATLRILKDPALATRMGLAGRQRVVEKFSVERTADEYVRAYEDIIQGRWK